MLTTVEDVIEALGGLNAAASLTGVSKQAVCNWRSRGRISRGKFLVISSALEAKRVEVSPVVFNIDAIAEARA